MQSSSDSWNIKAIIALLASIGVIVVSVALILNFSGLLDISGFLSSDNGDSIDSINSSTFYEWPEVVVGTEKGEVYYISSDSRPQRLGNVDNDIMNLETSESSVFITSTNDNTDSEEQGNYGSQLTKISSSQRNKIEFDGPIHDLEASEGSLYLTSLEENSKGESGTLHVLDSNSLDENNRIDLHQAYGVEVSNNTVVAFGLEGAVLTMDSESNTVQDRFKVGQWIGNVDISNDRLYFSSRRERQNRITQDLVNTVTNGHVSEHTHSGEEIFNMSMGITSVPHEIKKFSENEIIISGANGKVKFISTDTQQVVKELERNDDLTNMVISDGKAYIVGKDKQKVYLVNLDNREIEREIDVPGITSIARFESNDFSFQ